MKRLRTMIDRATSLPAEPDADQDNEKEANFSETQEIHAVETCKFQEAANRLKRLIEEMNKKEAENGH